MGSNYDFSAENVDRALGSALKDSDQAFARGLETYGNIDAPEMVHLRHEIKNVAQIFVGIRYDLVHGTEEDRALAVALLKDLSEDRTQGSLRRELTNKAAQMALRELGIEQEHEPVQGR